MLGTNNFEILVVILIFIKDFKTEVHGIFLIFTRKVIQKTSKQAKKVNFPSWAKVDKTKYTNVRFSFDLILLGNNQNIEFANL